MRGVTGVKLPPLTPREVAMDLAVRIRLGQFAAGSALPSVHFISHRYRVTNLEASRAVRIVLEMGLARPRLGGGFAVEDISGAHLPTLERPVGAMLARTLHHAGVPYVRLGKEADTVAPLIGLSMTPGGAVALVDKLERRVPFEQEEAGKA